MTASTVPAEVPPKIELKDRALAAFLAWLVPGLGHWYQGRRAKAILYFVCIMGIFGYGVYLGSMRDVKDPSGRIIRIGAGRAVYFAFTKDEWRLHFFSQIGVGLPTMPAVVQAIRVGDGKAPLLGGFMAPPRVEEPGFNRGQDDSQPTLSQLNYYLNRDFELATTYTMIAGLLNILAIYDAYAGPLFVHSSKKEEEEEPKKEEKKDTKKEGG